MYMYLNGLATFCQKKQHFHTIASEYKIQSSEGTIFSIFLRKMVNCEDLVIV